MAELVRESLAALLDAIDAPGFALRVLDLPQFLTPCDQPPNTLRGGDALTLWLAPDCALQVGGDAPAGFVSDVTDGLAIFALSGPRAADIVAMGCALDLPPQGMCAQTVFAGVKVVLYRHGDTIRLHGERQLAAFLHTWFQTAVTALP